LGVLGSVIAGPALGWLMQRVTRHIEHVPTAIILQFVGTFGVWLLAERHGLSGVLTTVCFAMTLARIAPAQIPARIRVPTNAVWATATFALNIFAFIFIGLQIRPVVAQLGAPEQGRYVLVAGAVLATVIGVRIVWHMSFNGLVRWRDRRHGFHPPRPMLRASVGSGVVISWAGMRGIVTLASALALPPAFPMRELIVFVAFSTVLGTLLIHGSTLGMLMRVLNLRDDDPVTQELRLARERAVAAVLAALPSGTSPAADLVRRDVKARLTFADEALRADAPASAYAQAYGSALRAARTALFDLRDRGEIGDDAFHALENQLDWLELAGPSGTAA
jgi:CPA1 family monovalent cation:H+ antiporter